MSKPSVFQRILSLIRPKAQRSSVARPFFSTSRVTASSVLVTPKTSPTHPALFAAMRLISSSLASLPWIVYQRDGDSRRRAEWLPAYDLLKNRPNAVQTPFAFFEYLVTSLLLYGNFFALVHRRIRKDGPTVYVDPVSLTPLDPEQVEVRVTQGSDGLLTKTFLIRGIEYTTSQILHIAGWSRDGVVGESVVSMIAESLGIGLACRRFNAQFFANGAIPTVVLETPNQLRSKEEVDLLREAFLENYGPHGSQLGVAVLHSGLSIKPLTMRPEDTQIIETLKASDLDIARALGVPPHMIGILDKGGYNSIEHQSIEFVQNCLRPWIVRIEQGLNQALFPPGSPFYVEANVDGLLRGDVLTRYKVYQIAVTNGLMSRNEARRLENMPPYDGGDVFLTPVNLGATAQQEE